MGAEFSLAGEGFPLPAHGYILKPSMKKDEMKTQVFVYFEPDNAEWLDMTVATLKRTRQRTNRSELIDLAVTLLQKKSPQAIEKLLCHRDSSAH